MYEPKKKPFAQGGQQFYCKKNTIIINYWYNTDFSISIVGLTRYFNVPRLKIVAQKLLFCNLQYSVEISALYTMMYQYKI